MSTTQAAERLRDAYATMEGCRIYNCPPDEAVERMREDEVTLAKAWLAEHPADDDYDLDEAWLRRIGFEAMDMSDSDGVAWTATRSFTPPRKFAVTTELTIWSFGDCIISQGYDREPQQNWNAIKTVEDNIGTRGDLRRLCGLIGVSLAEGGGE